MPHISAKPGLVRGTGLAGMGQQQPRYTKAPDFVRPAESDPMWRERAACAGTNSDVFFGLDGERGPERERREGIAAAFCRTNCPVMLECRAWAMDSGQDSGVWGGLGEEERRSLKRRKARQRLKVKA